MGRGIFGRSHVLEGEDRVIANLDKKSAEEQGVKSKTKIELEMEEEERQAVEAARKQRKGE